MESKLAIIIPVLNCLDYTRQMISTISTQKPYKLILLDNGSTDGTKKYFDSLAKVENIKVVHFKENIGVCPAWNFGISLAIRKFNSRYFFIPNNDILLHPRCIDLLLEAIKSPKASLVSATDVSGRVCAPLDVLGLRVPTETNLIEAPDFSCFITKKETIERVGYFDEKFYPAYFEDNDYHYRINLAGLKAVKTNRALYFHYGSRSIKNNDQIKTTADYGYTINRDYYYRKWGGLPGAEMYEVPFNKL